MTKVGSALSIITIFLTTAFLAETNYDLGIMVNEDSWITVAPLPGAYYGILGAVALDEKIYFFGEGICERYDPETDTWLAIKPPPIYNAWATVVTCQNKIYIIGGISDLPTQVYDPLTDSWENRTSIPTTLLGHKANVVNDKIYVISGGIPSYISIVKPSDATYVYDPTTDSWSTMASIPTPVQGYASTVLNDKIYIIGGGPATVTVENATCITQIFDPETNQWTTGKPLLTGVYGASACSTSGLLAPKRIYVVGGNLYYSGGGTSADLRLKGSNLNQVYDPETETWFSAASLPDNRWFLSLVNVNDTIYAIGGLNASYLLVSVNIQATEKYFPTGYIETGLPSSSPSQPTSSTFIDWITNFSIEATIAVVFIAAIITFFVLTTYYMKKKKFYGNF